MVDAPVGPLLAGKLSPPPAPAALLARPRLTQWLDAADVPLTLVVAPAGWGKSTLLSAWAHHVAPDADDSLAWLSLDRRDDEPLRFWRYLASALAAALPTQSRRAQAALTVPGVDPLEVAVPELVNGLATRPAGTVVVLDDLHAITDARIHDGLELLVEHLPPGSRLVVGTRTAPPLPLARLRARGRLRELRADDLRLRPAEARALLATLVPGAPGAPGEPGPRPPVEEVIAQTEGWAAGLVLGAAALREGRPLRRGDWPGQGPAVEFLMSEVVAGLEPSRREFLLDSAALGTVCGGLCDEVLQREDSGRLLAELEREGAFLTAVDESGTWYRYHRVFRRALVRTPADPARTADLLSRAAQWYLRHDLTEDAVRALLRAGDQVGAGRVLTEHTGDFLRNGDVGAFARLGEEIPEAVVARAPALALSLAWAAGRTGRLDRVPRLLDLAEAGVGSSPEAARFPGWRSATGAAAALRSVYGCLLAGDDDGAAALRYAQHAVAEETDDRLPGWVVARVALGGALLARGDDARDVLRGAWTAPATSLLPPVSRLETAGVLAWSSAQHLFLRTSGDEGQDPDREREELRRLLRATAAEARQVEETLGRAAASAVALLHGAGGLLALSQGRVTPGLEALRRAGDLVTVQAHPSVAALVLTTLAEVEVRHGDARSARAAVEQARTVLLDAPAVPAVTARLQAAAAASARDLTAGSRPVLREALTERELSVLHALRGPLNQREIGRELHLSVNTVKGYTKSLYRKLDVVSRAEAVAVGRELGLC